MPLDFRDVVLVPFPFTSQTVSKKRPAVVVSSGEYNTRRPDIVVAAITSQLRTSVGFGEVWITDWKAAGLLKPSVVKPVLATLEQSLIIRKMGSLRSADAEAVQKVLARVLSMANSP